MKKIYSIICLLCATVFSTALVSCDEDILKDKEIKNEWKDNGNTATARMTTNFGVDMDFFFEFDEDDVCVKATAVFDFEKEADAQKAFDDVKAFCEMMYESPKVELNGNKIDADLTIAFGGASRSIIKQDFVDVEKAVNEK